MRLPVRSFPAGLAILAALVSLAGCRSAWIQADIVNQQDTPVNLVIVNYAGGSFGVQSIAPHADYRYRFHLLGTEKVTLDYTDAVQRDRKSTGPELQKGEFGTLRIEIQPGDRVAWIPSLTLRR